MQTTVQELAALVGGQFCSLPDRVITGFASLSDALESDIAFFASPKYVAQLRSTRAGAILVPHEFPDGEMPHVALIRVENPSKAFTQIAQRFAPSPVVFPPGIHPAAVVADDAQVDPTASIQPCAVIESGARIGARTVIGAGSYIGHGACIGEDCQLAPRVTIGARCVVGHRVIMHSGVVLGADGFGYEFDGSKHVKVPQIGIVQIEDDVEIGANTTIDRARFGRTWVKAGTKIDNQVQIGHNVIVGQHGVICGQVGIAGSARLGNYVTLGGQSGVNGHIEICDKATLGGAGGFVSNTTEPGIYMGYPAVESGEYRRQVARIHRLGKLVERVKRLERLLDGEIKSLPPITD